MRRLRGHWLALALAATIAEPAAARADDAGSEDAGMDADAGTDAEPGVPLACDGALCATTTGGTCAFAPAATAEQARFALAAFAFTLAWSRRRDARRR